MDEKIQNILDCVREKVAVIGDTAMDAAGGVGTRARELLFVGKLNVRLAELESSVVTELRHVGEMIYATHTGNPTESEVLLEKLREIDELYAQMEQVKREISRARGLPVCEACGNAGEKGDLYCRECGRQL